MSGLYCGTHRVIEDEGEACSPDFRHVDHRCPGCRHYPHYAEECAGHDGGCRCIGRGPRSAMITNEAGGRQSRVDYFVRGVPMAALLRVARVMREGAESHEDDDPFGDVTKRNWHKISAAEHLEHALIHVALHVEGVDGSEEHASHFVTRAMMFLEMLLRERGERP